MLPPPRTLDPEEIYLDQDVRRPIPYGSSTLSQLSWSQKPISSISYSGSTVAFEFSLVLNLFHFYIHSHSHHTRSRHHSVDSRQHIEQVEAFRDRRPRMPAQRTRNWHQPRPENSFTQIRTGLVPLNVHLQNPAHRLYQRPMLRRTSQGCHVSPYGVLRRQARDESFNIAALLTEITTLKQLFIVFALALSISLQVSEDLYV